MLQDRYDLAFRLYPYERAADQDAQDPVRHPAVIVGAGPVGLTMALDLGLQGIPVVLLDDHEGVGQGSKAICFAKRTLEIAQRHGFGQALVNTGVTWNLGKVFHDDHQVFEFDLQPEDGHRCPAFINLQQPYFEKTVVDRIAQARAEGAPIQLRGRNRVDGIEQRDDHVVMQISTPDGPYRLEADWLLACDGAASPLRKMVGADFTGRVFEDSFLIADIRMSADFPTERWFWFEPHFKSGASALLHKQPDDVWRVDFQIGWDVDRKEELKDSKIRKRLDAMLGPKVDYELVWSSIYTFQCRRIQKFRHNRVIFAGDSAHQVSPFGARGANSGIQDADNLGWKLGRVIRSESPEQFLDSYHDERSLAADENILNSTRSTDFITPKPPTSHLFRNAVLDLAQSCEFARPMVNSGRLSLPCHYKSALNGVDALPHGPKASAPGSPCPDAPLSAGYVLDHLGACFVLLVLGGSAPALSEPAWSGPARSVPAELRLVSVPDDALTPLLRARYLGDAPQAVYLIRPDQHVTARWAAFNSAQIENALKIATGKDLECPS